MISSTLSAPLRSVTSLTFAVSCIVQTFVHQTPLNSGKIVVVDGHVFFARPTKGAVVNNPVAGIFNTYRTAIDKLRIAIFVLAQTHSHAHVANNNILTSSKIHLVSANANTIAGSGLSCNGKPGGAAATQLRFKMNDTRHAKHHSERFVGILSQSPAKTAGTGIVKIGHFHYLTSTSAGGPSAVTFGGGECGYCSRCDG